MKVYKTPAGEYNLILQEGTDDYRLLQNFLATTGKNLPDVRLKMLFEKMTEAYKNAESKADNTQPANNVVSQGYSTQVSQKLDLVSQKVDSVIRAIGGIGNIKTAPAQIDLSALEGAVVNMEKNLTKQLSIKLEAVVEGVAFNNLCNDIGNIFKQELAELKGLTQKVVATHEQIASTNKILDLEIPTITTMEAETRITEAAKAEKEETQVAMEDFTKPAESEATVSEDMIRYPARKKKNVKPKCYGNYMEGDTSPCSSCVWVNDCSLKIEDKASKDVPPCFGEYKADLKCGGCPFNTDCMDS